MNDLPLPWTLGYKTRRGQTLRSLVEDTSVIQLFATAAALPPLYTVGLDERCIELP